MIKKQGRTYVSALRYMIMSLVGSGLFLIGLTLLYSITGHLLMSPAKEVLEQIVAVHSISSAADGYYYSCNGWSWY